MVILSYFDVTFSFLFQFRDDVLFGVFSKKYFDFVRLAKCIKDIGIIMTIWSGCLCTKKITKYVCPKKLSNMHEKIKKYVLNIYTNIFMNYVKKIVIATINYLYYHLYKLIIIMKHDIPVSIL